MNVIILFLSLTFFKDYEHFVVSKKADLILSQFGQDTMNYRLLENDPVQIWFIRDHFPNPSIDSLLLASKSFIRQPEISAALRWEARRLTNRKVQLDRLRQAEQFDPYAFDNFLSLIVLGLELRDAKLVKGTLAGLLKIVKDFQIQVLLLTNLGFLVYLGLLAFGFVFVFSHLFKYFTLLGHRLGLMSHGLRDYVGALIILTPLAIFFNPYLLFILYSIMLLFVLTAKERRWLRLYLAIILLSVPLSVPVTTLSNFLDRRSKTYELYSYFKITYPEAVIKYSRPDELFIVAYSLKKQNLLETARAVYQNLLLSKPNDYEASNNLGNLDCELQHYELAESLYQRAIRLQPGRGEAYFNLGWCYLKELRFLEASKSIEHAKSLHFTPIVEGTSDIAPRESFFWRSLFNEKVRLRFLFNLRFIVAILVVLLLSFVVKPLSEPTRCTLCARPLCSKCAHAAGDNTYCHECWTKLSKTQNEQVEQSVIDVTQLKRRRWEVLKSLGLTLLLPGLATSIKEE